MKKGFVHNLKSTYEAIMDLEIPSFLIVQEIGHFIAVDPKVLALVS